jgi:CRP-like cAMP-binding protein
MPGEVLFMRGSGVEHSYLVLSGRLKITAPGPRGNELLVAISEPGDLMGFVAAIDADERFVNAIALRSSEVITIDRNDLIPILKRTPETMLTMLAMMTQHLRSAVDLAQDIGLLDSQGRLWSRLMSFSERYGSPGKRNGSLRVDHGLSQEDLASSIGMTRVVVNRTLRIWRELGFIETGRGYVEITKPDLLEKHVVGQSETT